MLDGLASRTIGEVVSSATFVELPSPSTIYEAGEKSRGLYILLSGRVRLSLPLSASQKNVVAILEAGQWFGERESLLRDQTMTSAETIEPATLAHIPKNVVQKCLCEDRAFALKLLSDA